MKLDGGPVEKIAVDAVIVTGKDVVVVDIMVTVVASVCVCIDQL